MNRWHRDFEDASSKVRDKQRSGGGTRQSCPFCELLKRKIRTSSRFASKEHDAACRGLFLQIVTYFLRKRCSTDGSTKWRVVQVRMETGNRVADE
jgi:hypothetical protein